MRVLASLILIAIMSPAFAQDTAPLPHERPEAAGPVAPEAPLVPLPRVRPEETAAPADEPPAPDTTVAPVTPVAEEPVAEPEPERDYQTACPAVLEGQVEATALPPIADGQCMAQSPLSVTGVLANGRMIPLSGGAVLDCGMATALPQWVADVDSYLWARDNTRIDSVIGGTTYMCRKVNNASEGNLSFHALGAAIDIAGFTLADGRTVTVTEAWTGSAEQGSGIMRFAHDAACTHFTTVLGPEANALHHDHLHLDLGCHGQSCVARLCE